MRMRSPSRMARFGLPGPSFTWTFPPSHARLASDRVLKRHATSSQTSRRRLSLTLDQYLDFTLGSEPLDEGVGLLLTIPLKEILLESRFDFIESDGARRLLLGDLDDVEAELRFDEIADGARGQAERRVVERTDHLSLLKESEVAAVGGASRILRVLLRQCREVLARLCVLEDLL